MDIASALIKQLLVEQDIATWTNLRRNYLPPEYFPLFDRVESFLDRFKKLPTFEELKFDTKSKQLLQRITIVEQVEVTTSADILIEFLKNEYSQRLVLEGVDKFIGDSVAFETAKETVEAFQELIVDIERKIDLDEDQESMQKIDLFEPEEVMSRYVKLGLNHEFDNEIQYKPTDLIMIGGRRGSGKSIVCANRAANAHAEGKSSLYFTIEMDQRDILQRITAIGAGVSANRIKNKSLNADELARVAKWWASRFEGGVELYEEAYNLSVKFDNFHKKLSALPLKKARFEIIYDPQLTMAKIRSECERRVPLYEPSIIMVDYINKIKLSKTPSKKGAFDWGEQIEVANMLKADIAQKYSVPVLCPYQVDAAGEARFAKGILDPADASFVLDPHSPEDAAMSFTCTKDRRNKMTDFTSSMDWDTLKIGPASATITKEEEEEKADDTPRGGWKH